jgi:hypothetical protein
MSFEFELATLTRNSILKTYFFRIIRFVTRLKNSIFSSYSNQIRFKNSILGVFFLKKKVMDGSTPKRHSEQT